MFPKLQLSNEYEAYLRSRKNDAWPLTALLALGLLYTHMTGIADKMYEVFYSRILIYFLLIALGGMALRLPRWMLYTIFLLLAAAHIHIFTQQIAIDHHDFRSIRDDVWEVCIQKFLGGDNPWNFGAANPNVPITTGPTSILLGLPFVAAFGNVNWLLFLFWIGFLLVLLVGDIRRKNRSFPVLVLLFLTGIFGFQYTLYWSQEEIYIPFLFLAGAYALIERGRLTLAGALLGAALLVRLNHAFTVFAFFCWCWLSRSFGIRETAKAALGMAIAAILILMPFVVVGGEDFWKENSIRYAFRLSGTSVWPETNIFFEWLNQLSETLDSSAMKKLKPALVLAIVGGASFRLRRMSHPFWHIALAAFLAHTVAWLDYFPKDYMLFFVTPAFIAVALTDKRLIGGKNDDGSDKSF